MPPGRRLRIVHALALLHGKTIEMPGPSMIICRCEMFRGSNWRLFFPVAALGLLIFCGLSPAQTQLTRTTKAAHEVLLEGYVYTNNKCESRDPPTVYLDQPPERGVVCFRPSEVVLHRPIGNHPGPCVGQKKPGIAVVYLPRKAYSGPDKVRFPNAHQTVEINVTILPDDPQSGTEMPSEGDSSACNVPQMPGPLPGCAALMS